MKRLLSMLAALVALALASAVATRLPLPRAVRAEPTTMAASASERGRMVYERYGCSMCHGGDGTGGFVNLNAETDGKVPGVTYVKEGYTEGELRKLILNGAPRIGKADASGPTPPYRMPGWRDQMSEQELSDLVQYLFSLYPESAETKWR